MTAIPLPDAHVHLAAIGLPENRPALCVTCTPAEFTQARGRYQNAALGLHPWRITDDNADELLSSFAHELPNTRFIGEVGLDFYKAHALFASAQLKCFRFICKRLSSSTRVISIHSRSADRKVLDVLESNGLCKNSICIMHGFNGSGDQFSRARALGCMFSFGLREFATRRGREYARQTPMGQILLETDADETKPFTESDWKQELNSALEALNAIKGHDMSETIAGNWTRVIGR